MRKFLEAAYITLKREKEPLSPDALTKKAIEYGVLKSVGKTPQNSMRARLSTDILKKREKSLFKRTAAGTFALREWDDKEFHAPRHKKTLFDEDIVVFDKVYLKEIITRNGLIPYDLNKVKEKVFKIWYPLRRRLAEENENIIQLISVFIVKYNNKYLTFKRTKRLPESRLHGFYSIGFGGHISQDDLKPLFNVFDPNTQPFIIRELKEELKLKYNPLIEFRGLLYDDSMPVSIIHLGIVYDVFLKDTEYEIGEKGFLMDPKFENIKTIKNRIDNFENWSQIIIEEEFNKHESEINI